MQIKTPKNTNYAATVVTIKNIVPLDGCDNVVGTTIFGYQAIVGKETKIGDIGLFFPAETQLSEEFCIENNLFRHTEKNKDKTKRGYMEDNRRVKAMKFRGHRSDCLFIDLDSVSYACSIDELVDGMVFDELNEKEICRKYEIVHIQGNPNMQKIPKFKRVEEKFIPQHIDSDHYLRVSDVIPDYTELIVTQKLHGTSIRIANTIVKRKLNPIEWLLSKVGVSIQLNEFDYVFGSRKVIKDANNPNHNHFYDVDLWTIEGKKLVGLLPKNYIVYGELIGFTPNGQPIQKNYTYNLAPNMCRLYVYRVSFVNEDGIIADLSFDAMSKFCSDRGLFVVPTIWRGIKKDFVPEGFINKRFYDSGMTQCVPLSDLHRLPDEGVCIRIEGIIPYITKLKSPAFLEHETKMLDKEVEDIEAQN